jgi:hypothetical protein
MRIKKLNKYVWFIGLLALSVTMVVIGIRCSSKSSTNSGTNNSGGVPSATSLTISGVLQQGSVVISATNYSEGKLQTADIPLSSSNLSPLSATPLSGYQLYCVTFANPPAAGTGIADASGNVAVTFSATSTPFGCFILDSSNKGVATLFFTNTTNGQKGQTVSCSGDTNLGTIMVDTADGVALATLPSNGTIVSTTPTGTPCPIGTWTGLAGPSPCSSGDISIILLIAQKPSGEYIVSFSVSPIWIDTTAPICSPDVCGTYSDNASATYSGGTSKLSFNGDPGDPCCSQKVYNVTATFDASCKTMNINLSTVGCSSCSGSGGCSGCGTTTCSETFTVTRQ